MNIAKSTEPLILTYEGQMKITRSSKELNAYILSTKIKGTPVQPKVFWYSQCNAAWWHHVCSQDKFGTCFP